VLVIVPVALYLTVQILAGIKLRGVARLLAVLPLIPMVWIAVVTVGAYRQESNLWPILLIFASPMAALYIGVVWVVAKKNHGLSAGESEPIQPR
jgi:hypothetical protein